MHVKVTVHGAQGARVLQGKAHGKLRLSIAAMRLLSLCFIASILWHLWDWWRDGERVVRLLGTWYGKDLSGMQAWQRHAALGLDLSILALVIVAVAYCWRFLATLQQGAGFTEHGLRFLKCCAWWGLASEALSLAARPLRSYLLTLHLPPPAREWRWSVQSADIQSVILCLSLLMFAMMFSWALEIAEENKGFV